jgi:ribosomal protein S4E
MIRIFILSLALLCGSMMSCSSVHYINEDGTELKYSRILGKQQIKGFKVTVNADGSKQVEFDSSSGDNTKALDVMMKMAEVMVKMAIIP